jgi:fructose-bisphosphate aldolase / 2-amino-3,7-dideoxy-D-threo-hept-6-ulosonate synthase
MPPDGRLLVVAMDHTVFLDRPVPALAAYGSTCEQAVSGGADAFLVPLGSAALYAEQIGSAALVASVQIQPPMLEVAIERALAVGADAVKCMVYPFGEDNSVLEAGRLGAEASRAGLPFIAETIPGGFGRRDLHTPEKIAAAARIGVEVGADMIKTFYTGDPESMGTVIRNAGVPVLVLGGPKMATTRDVLQLVHDAVVVAGAAGVAFGTNIWTCDDPRAMTAAIAAVMHGGASVDEALGSIETPADA